MGTYIYISRKFMCNGGVFVIQNIDGIMTKESLISMIEYKMANSNETFTLASIDIDSFEAVNSYYVIFYINIPLTVILLSLWQFGQ